MNCEEIKNLMDAYLDGELDPMTSQKSNSTCGTARSVSKRTKWKPRWLTRLAKPHLITKRQLNCVNGSRFHYERPSACPPAAALEERIRCRSDVPRQCGGAFSLTCRGTGWRWPQLSHLRRLLLPVSYPSKATGR